MTNNAGPLANRQLELSSEAYIKETKEYSLPGDQIDVP